MDGGYVGRVDQFDGFPRYLWLDRGTRHVVIYKPGFETLARRVRIRPGERIDLREQMVAGEAKTPDELFEQLEPSEEETVAVATPPPSRSASRRPSARPPADDSWREPRSPPATSVQVDQRRAPGRVRLLVEPADAVVYLDGRLLGSGEELARLHHGLMVDPGRHEVQVVRPGHETTVREFDIGVDEDIELRVELPATDR